MKDVFIFIGEITCVAIGTLIVLGLGSFLRYAVDRLRWKWAYKHRFDKKPLAKCYCKDCCHHNTLAQIRTGVYKCYIHSFESAPDEFYCKDAKPKEE